MNKKGFEFSFTWLFAIIAGAVIIFIAVFAATNLIDVSREEGDAKTAEQLGILLNPIETNLEDARYAVIRLPAETKISNKCSDSGNFGRQIISTSVKSGLGEEFKKGSDNFFFNKYLFSLREQQGKNLYVISKPFEMPYKIADLVFVSSEIYCFINPPGDVEDEIVDLDPANINISSDSKSCPRNSRKVCFNRDDCEISVNLNLQTVKKEGKEVYYEDSLFYGAIFSDSDIYECQVKRLMKRNSELAHLYAAKSDFLEGKGCSSNLAIDLRDYASSTDIETSFQLKNLKLLSDNLQRRNSALICRIF